jgi:hypothetical protein
MTVKIYKKIPEITWGLVPEDYQLGQAAIKYGTLLLLSFYGEPDLMGSIIAWIGRYPS